MEKKNMINISDTELNNVNGGTSTETEGRKYKNGDFIRFVNVFAWDPTKFRPDTLDGYIIHVYDSHPVAGGIYKYVYKVKYEYGDVGGEVDLVEQQIICLLA